MAYRHIPVMLEETVALLNCSPGKIYADCTLGGGGHARAILEKILPDGLLIGVDQDRDAIRNAGEVFGRHAENMRLFHGNFTQLPEFMSQLGIRSLDGIVMDLGISSDQLESGGRGFSFHSDEPLDMRMNTDFKTRACDLIDRASEEELANIFFEYGEERRSRRIAKRIVAERKHRPIRTSARLAEIIAGAVPAKARYGQRIHPATRAFMALRIAVNEELERLGHFMDTIVAKDGARILNPKGRLCVISFHSLEDRIVKRRLKSLAKGCECPPNFPVCVCNHEKTMRILTKKAICPSDREIAENPLARSAKLRAAEKVNDE